MKFLVDMPVTPLTVTHLRVTGHDAVHAHEIGLARAADTQLLDVARREARVIITADLDYPRLLALHQASRPGIILFRGGARTRTPKCSACSIGVDADAGSGPRGVDRRR